MGRPTAGWGSINCAGAGQPGRVWQARTAPGVAMLPGEAGINVRKTARYASKDCDPLQLIMGIAAQSINWPDAFCHGLVEGGLQVIRFDNRDSGLSTHLTDAPPPDLPAALAGDLSSVSYTLSDMATDPVGLLDVLGFGKAHVVGASMGGAIAQTMAIEHPDRVRSLTSMMSTTGNMSDRKST